MPRLKRFEEHRFVGARDTMLVYDTDDPEQSEELSGRIERDGLFRRNLLQTFGPDEIPEARNRGFRPRA